MATQTPPFQPKVAICVIGLMRCLDATQPVLVSMSRFADIYVVTSIQYKPTLENAPWIHAAFFIEEDATEAANQKRFSSLDGGTVFLQWQKMKIALDLIQRHESLRGQNYETIIKVRSDLTLEKLNISHFAGLEEDQLLSQSDLVFGGPRSAMMEFKDLLEFAETRMYRSERYIPLNWVTVGSWDPFAAATHRLLLPITASTAIPELRFLKLLFRLVTGTGHGLLRTHKLARRYFHWRIRHLAPELLNLSHEEGFAVDIERGGNFFPSERTFATFAALRELKLISIRPALKLLKKRKHKEKLHLASSS
jgi:hypothetical protein